MNARIRGLRSLCLLLAVTLLSGCGSGTGTVSGKLTVSGKPVTSGANIVFIGPTGDKGQALVSSDGTYEMDNAPVGKVAVTVVNAPLPPDPSETTQAPAPEEMMKIKKKAVKPPSLGRQVPRKYETAENGLSYKVTSGSNTIDIDLTPN